MKTIIFTILALGLLLPLNVKSQGIMCANAQPICFLADSCCQTYPASVNSGYAESGPAYGCLYTQPNPAWFYFLVTDSGSIDLSVTNSNNYDIDAICWGPFAHPTWACLDNSMSSDSTIVDCSYTTAYEEILAIPDALPGEYYIFMVTNYSNFQTNITLSQSNYSADTAGHMECILVLDSVSSNSPLCISDTLLLTAPYINNATYSWTGPAGFVASVQNPIILNFQSINEGYYNVVVIGNGDILGADTYIEAANAPAAQIGLSSQNGYSGTFYIYSASDSNIVYYGDGEFDLNVNPMSNVIHYYPALGAYDITLICFSKCGNDTMTISVNIYGVGLMDYALRSKTIFPNPTTGKCIIEGMMLNEITRVECRSIDGKLLYSGPAAGLSDGSNTLFDLSNYSPGMYTLTIQTALNRYAVKVIRGS